MRVLAVGKAPARFKILRKVLRLLHRCVDHFINLPLIGCLGLRVSTLLLWLAVCEKFLLCRWSALLF